MSRLNLEAFKEKANVNQELESLTGGILGACHCTWTPTAATRPGLASSISDYIHYAMCDEHDMQ
ncbi:hypothetical protein [Croceitalea dokdonensis]|uniref:hypothetical protein n=1 Tax=Croceitalea dokdonensis TaxID=346188 RepID=UPI0006C9EA4B|nr:hypothetical protein [Croceitalea dokdonensis]